MKKFMKFNVSSIGLPFLFCWLTTELTLASFANAQQHDDSVSSGKYKVSRQIFLTITDQKNADEFKIANYILKEVLMRSTANFYKQGVAFGPYKNGSGFPLTITLTHVGGQASRHSRAYVDGITVAHNFENTIFTIQPGSTYSWTAQDSHSISAWILTRDNKGNTGLPSKNDFLNPQFILGKYRGCIKTPGINSPEKLYYYNINGAGMSDGSDVWWVNYKLIPEFDEMLAEGPRPAIEGVCVEKIEEMSPYPIDSGNGGGG